MRTRLTACLLLCALLAAATAAHAQLRAAGLFTDNMVMQRDMPVAVWGWARSGDTVSVEFAGQTKTGRADAAGTWSVRLDPLPASTQPRELVLRNGTEQVRLRNVVVGEVWLASGQSNMGIPLNATSSGPGRGQREDSRLLRIYTVPNRLSSTPLPDVSGRWRGADSESIGSFPAVAYLFAVRLQSELGVPVGVIVSAVGASFIESWTPRETVEANPVNAGYVKNFRGLLGKTSAKGELVTEEHKNAPGACFNGKIAPLAPYALRGVLWYQGESNVGRFARYGSQMSDLIGSWRTAWGAPELPFLVTELAPFGRPDAAAQDSARARFAEALHGVERQVKNAWVITIVDGGDPDDIHPRRKDIPAERFAAMAFAKVYGRNVAPHGPRMREWKAEGNAISVAFANVGEGLAARAVQLGGVSLPADAPRGFELAGADRVFRPASATITGRDTLRVSSPEVPSPIALRYAWSDFPLANLYSRDGLAAYPFRTDDWPWTPTPSAKPRGNPPVER